MGYKMPKAVAQAKLKMVKSPEGNMVPEYAVDGKGANDMAAGKMVYNAPTKMKNAGEGSVIDRIKENKGPKMMKDPVTKMAKSMAYMSYGKAVAKNIGPDSAYIGPKKGKKY